MMMIRLYYNGIDRMYNPFCIEEFRRYRNAGAIKHNKEFCRTRDPKYVERLRNLHSKLPLPSLVKPKKW